MRKRTSILLLVCCVVFALLLWLVTAFSLRPAVCSMPVPGATADPPEGQVALSTIQLLPRYRVPVTFTDVQVQDLTTGERLHPDLVLYDQESVHLLMTSTVVCTREDFAAYFSEAPQFPVQGRPCAVRTLPWEPCGRSGLRGATQPSTRSPTGSLASSPSRKVSSIIEIR